MNQNDKSEPVSLTKILNNFSDVFLFKETQLTRKT